MSAKPGIGPRRSTHKRTKSGAAFLPSPKKNLPASSKDMAISQHTRSHSPMSPLSAGLDYRIRPMTMADLSSVYHLGLGIFTAQEYPALYRTWDEFTVVEYLASSREYCFVVEVGTENAGGEEIVGFLLGETITKSDTIGLRGYIEWVAVHSKYRRRGIASELIHEFKEVAKKTGARVLLADTPAENEAALALLKKSGLAHRTDHVYMSRQLEVGEDTRKDISDKIDEDDNSFEYRYSVKRKNGGGSTTRITIRNMNIDDLYPVFKLGQEIFTRRNANLYHFWDEDTVMLSYQSDPELCAIATIHDSNSKEDKVIGFAFGTTIEKPRSSWKYGYLVWLGCDPGYRGLGLAKQLYHTLMELFVREKVRMLMVDTQSSNHEALAFFRKLGFDKSKDEDHVYLCNEVLKSS